MLDTAKLFLSHRPFFWCALTTAFFLLGLLYAAAHWRSWKKRLLRASREQASLLRLQKRAIADHQRRHQRTNAEPTSSADHGVQTAAKTIHVAASAEIAKYFSASYPSSGTAKQKR